MYDNTQTLLVLDNVIRRNGDGGVELDDSSLVTVQDNDIRDNRWAGIAAYEGSFDVTIDGNTLIDNSGDGIFLDFDTATITVTGTPAKDNGHHDCDDRTLNANFWVIPNNGGTQNRVGLCDDAITIERLR